MTDWRDTALTKMTLAGPLAKANLGPALTDPPVVTRIVDGASSLELAVLDDKGTLLRSKMLDAVSTVTVDKLTYHLQAVAKSGSHLTLTFEDAVTYALSRQKGALTAPAGSTTRADFLRRLASRAKVPALIDPSLDRNRARNPLAREKDEDSWVAAGRIAEEVQARRFTDGTHLIVGGDKWLIARQQVVHLAERSAGIDAIDFDFDTGQKVQTATLTARVERWKLPPGTGVRLDGMGPASAVTWLVSSVSRPLTSRQTSVDLVARQALLPEPKKES